MNNETVTEIPETAKKRRQDATFLENFKQELEHLINKHSMENRSNTPDFILADYLVRCLENFEIITTQREKLIKNNMN